MSDLNWKSARKKISSLKPFERNPRKITPAAMAKLKDRIQKRGFHDVLKLDTNDVVLSGNMRLKALTELEINEVNVLIPSRELTKEERDTIVLESNRTDGEDDIEILSSFDTLVLLETGFESKDVDALKETDEDEEDPFDSEKVVEQIKKPKAKRGDLYELGEHRLMCGDSTDPKDLEKLMDGKKARQKSRADPVRMESRQALFPGDTL